MEQSRVLIVSDDAEFVNSIVQSWHRSSCTPEFAVSSIRGLAELSARVVVVVDGREALSRVPADVVLAITITRDEPLTGFVDTKRRVVQIRRSPGWADIVAMLTYEVILRVDAQQRVVEVEHQLRQSERFASLGRFITEARHGLANALTSVLGNSELLLMDPGTELRDEVHGQLETIHAMSLKIHETLQRLSSLDRKMQVAERQAEQASLGESAKAAGTL